MISQTRNYKEYESRRKKFIQQQEKDINYIIHNILDLQLLKHDLINTGLKMEYIAQFIGLYSHETALLKRYLSGELILPFYRLYLLCVLTNHTVTHYIRSQFRQKKYYKNRVLRFNKVRQTYIYPDISELIDEPTQYKEKVKKINQKRIYHE